MWLEEIFRTIASEALDARNGNRIKHLAEAGAYLALEKMIDCLRAAGLAVVEEGGAA